MIHMYRADLQPATRFVDATDDPPLTITFAERHLIWTDCCHQHRWAKYVEVQCFFDGVRRWCAPGRGCKKGRKR